MVRRKSSLSYVIEAFIPFTEANISLTFRPNAFFNELEKRGDYRRNTIKQAFYQAKSQGLIVFDEEGVSLSTQARGLIDTTPVSTLPEDTCFMVIFDIPEHLAVKRRQLRQLLRQLKFSQRQRSVWTCRSDHRTVVHDLINELKIQPYVETFLSKHL